MAMLQIISAVCLSQWEKFTLEPPDKLLKNDLYLPPRAKLNVFRNTLRNFGAQICNDLPANVKHYHLFKCLNQITSKCILVKNYYMSTSVQLVFITTCLNFVFNFVFNCFLICI